MSSSIHNQVVADSPAHGRQQKTASLSYVLVTPARNEAAFIEETIKAVVAQTVRPAKWLIVSDGSTDGTDEIVRKYTAAHEWIELLRMPERKERHFAGKVYAFNAGYAAVGGIDYDVIGNLDADITFEPGYFDFLLKKFAENPRLGVAGTPFTEGSRQYDYRFTNVEHVSGACQMFRRRCFEQVGGYRPIEAGGVDLVAVVTARMNGWHTRSFLERSCVHHRKQGSATRSTMSAAFALGRVDYTHGSDIFWQLFRSAYQMSRSPILLTGILLMAGYLWALIIGADRVVSPEMANFIKAEQRRRLLEFVKRRSVIGRWQFLDRRYAESLGDVTEGKEAG